MATGKVKTLYSDKEKTEALFPRTKTSAISDANGVGLDALMEKLIYSGTDNPEAAVVPLDADTLGGIPADDYATENFVQVKIAEAQMSGSGGDIDLSGYATKDDVANAVNAIDYPVDSVNGKTGAVQLSASDVGARPSNWMPTAANVGAAPSSHNHSAGNITSGTLPVSRGGTGATTLATALQAMFPDTAKPKYLPVFGSNWESRGFATPDELRNAMSTLPVSKGGTGATSAANARKSLGFNMFAAYDLSSSSWVGVMKDNWSSIADGNFIIYGRTGSVFCAVGVKAGKYGAALAFNYVDPELYLYRNNNGTWSEAAVIK